MNILKLLFIITVFSLNMIACGDANERKASNGEAVAENQTLKTIFERKSVRTYSDKEISEEIILDLLKAGMSAPSSRDRRPWQFIVISDKTILEDLGAKLANATMLKDANKAIIVCGDSIISDNCWFLDCSTAAQNILLAAESMKIGAVWTAVYPYIDRENIVRTFFQLPENIRVLSVIPLGYPLEEESPKDKFDETRIHYNKW
jgi:nitroreductase